MKYTYKVWADSTRYACCVLFSIHHGDRLIVKDEAIGIPFHKIFTSTNNTIKWCLKEAKKTAESRIAILINHEIGQQNG